MNIVFFGTSEFAIASFRELLDSRHKILALVTQPDRKKGRNLKLSSSPTKVLAITKGVPVYQPDNVSSAEAINYLRKLNPDLFIVIAFGQILKREALAIPKFYAVNLHGSLLPKYRGAAPTNWAIINGDKSSGVTVIRMNEKMDEGDIILKREVDIDEDDTNITLSEKLSGLGAKVLLEVIDSIENGKNITFIKQDDNKASLAPKLRKEDGLIDWNEEAVKIYNKIRGLLPWPGAYTHYNKRILKILQAELMDSSMLGKMAEPGEVVNIIKGKGIIVRAGSGNLAIKYLQLEGKRNMTAGEFLRGTPISQLSFLTNSLKLR